jgi:hypothetical protein
MKWVPQFVTIISGKLNQVRIWSYKNFVITIVVLVRKVLTSTHLVA